MNNSLLFVSVVIVNYNGRVFLKKCISSLLAQTYPAIEIILVDNGSSDESIEFVKNEFPSVKIIANKENLGFAKANNIGIKAAKGELIATLNNDTEVTPVWIEELMRAINSDENVGMCASKMLFMKNPKLINSTGICISRSGACWDRGIFENDCGQYESGGEVFGPCAGAALFKKNMLDEIGLFDEDFYMYMEDVDLAFRGRLAGWKCLYVPNALVYHLHSGTIGFETDFKVYYTTRNIIWNYIKNFPKKVLIASLPWIVARNIAIIPYYALKGHGTAILRSEVDAIKGITKMLAKRSRCLTDDNETARYIRTWANIHAPSASDMKMLNDI